MDLLVFILVFLGSTCNGDFGTYDEAKVSSLKMVELINALNVGWNATVYKEFAHMDWKDAKNMLGSKGAWPKDSPPKKFVTERAETIPKNFDSREKWPGSIHLIRNQGNCGSCWAFGASEALSDRFAIFSNNKIDVVLSAQELVDCDTNDYGCNGGYPIRAWNFMEEVGLLTVDCYGPYMAEGGACKINKTGGPCPSGVGMERFYKAASAYAIEPGNVEAIQTEIMNNGPVEASFTVYSDFFNYKSGVYKHVSGGVAGGHAIKMLGWGQTYEGVEYWICANSWGESWGMDGFFFILRGEDECGIESGVTAGLPAV